MADEPIAPAPKSLAPTARLIPSRPVPVGDYRITEDGQTRDFEDGEIEQIDRA
jgi:hypothetical protein